MASAAVIEAPLGQSACNGKRNDVQCELTEQASDAVLGL
jgi:hypothetical protein